MIIDTFEWFLPFKEYSVENTMEHEGNGGGWGEEAVKLIVSFLSESKIFKQKGTNKIGLEKCHSKNSESQPTLSKGNISKCRKSGPRYS